MVHLGLLYNPQRASVTRSDVGRRWNGYTTFLTTGAGSWGETADSCGNPGSYLYSNGGEALLAVVCLLLCHHSTHHKCHMPDLVDVAVGVVNLKGAVEWGALGARSALKHSAALMRRCGLPP